MKMSVTLLGAGRGGGGGGGGGGTGGAEATAFLARTTGLDATHTNAYIALIDGLVADGVWSLLDVLYMFCTQDGTTALLNLVSSSFTGVTTGSPSFVADQGFTGADAAVATAYIDSQFNPLSGSPQYTQNNAHISAWSNTSAASTANGGCMMGSINPGTGTYTQIFPRYSDGNQYYRINGSAAAGASTATAAGFCLANRSGTTTLTGYKNASAVVGPVSDGVGTPPNRTVIVLATGNVASVTSGWGGQASMASIGNALSGANITALYTRVGTFRTTVGL